MEWDDGRRYDGGLLGTERTDGAGGNHTSDVLQIVTTSQDESLGIHSITETEDDVNGNPKQHASEELVFKSS